MASGRPDAVSGIGLHVVRGIVVLTALVLTALVGVAPLGGSVLEWLVVGVLALVVAPLPAWIALWLLWGERLRSGLVLSRSIGLLGAVLSAILAHHLYFRAWPVRRGAVAVAVGVMLFEAALFVLAWVQLRKLAPGSLGRLMVAGHGLLLLAVLVLASFPGDSGHGLSRRESAAIGNLRTMASAEFAYSANNGGFYGSPECLAKPVRCLAGYAEDGPVFLDPEFFGERGGYVYTFHAGPPPQAEIIEKAGAAAGSLTVWAFVAVPSAPGRSAVRSFCLESTGLLFQRADERMPVPQLGRCPEGLQPVS